MLSEEKKEFRDSGMFHSVLPIPTFSILFSVSEFSQRSFYFSQSPRNWSMMRGYVLNSCQEQQWQEKIDSKQREKGQRLKFLEESKR